MKKGLIFAFMFLVVLAFSTPAKAVIVVDNWTLNLSGIDGLPGGTVYTNMDQITYYGIAHNETVVEIGPIGSSVGDIGVTDGFLTATGYKNTLGHALNFVGLEMTFDFSIAGENTSVNNGNVQFTHLAPGTYGGHAVDGYLDIWIDNLNDGINQQASSVTGDGYRDGTHIARMAVKSGDGGIFTPSTFDGSDDATFSAVAVLPGIFFDEYGNDLSINPEAIMLAFTDSNFDADPNEQNTFSILEPTNWSSYFSLTTGGNPPGDPSSSAAFFAEEDGSARIGVIPEPATMLLLGSGLFGLGFFGRKKRKS